jgi:AraC-like DNA-binding protein
MEAKTLCDHFHIGKTKLYEILRQSYGCGLGEHLRKLRMEHAKMLLEEHPEMSISEIATACGYENYNYFSRLFKRHFDVTPTNFKIKN